MPRNATDAVTMLHDIDYLRFAENRVLTILADEKAIANAQFDLPGIATKIGLTIRKTLFPNSFNKRINGMTVTQTRQLGEYLLARVRKDSRFVKTFEKFGVEL